MDRWVLITGASSGIGRATAEHLASRGFRVLAGVLPGTTPPAGADIEAVAIDVTDAASIAAARDAVAARVGDGGLAGLVNNAGIAVTGALEFVAVADWRRQFEVNVFGHVAVTQAMLPLLRARVRVAGWRSARVVMLSSILGRISPPILAPYAASKHAVEAVGDALRLEVKGQGIGVSLVEPGPVRSDIWARSREDASRLPADHPARTIYGRLLAAAGALANHSQETGAPALGVARAIERCLTAPRPPARVLVGRTARIGVFARRVLPGRAFDVLLRRTLRM